MQTNWQIIRKLFTAYWRSEEKYQAWGLISLVMGLNFGMIYYAIIINGWYAKFYDALQNYEKEKVFSLAFDAIPLISFSVILFVANNYFGSLFAFKWRTWLTKNYINLWTQDNNYYKLMNIKGALDNPDQRISEDIAQFTSSTTSIFISFIVKAITAIAFINILWNLGGTYNLKLFDHTYAIKGYLVWAILLYSLIGSIVSYIIGRPLVKLDFFQEKFTANFRYNLIRVRESREEIALFNGNNSENINLQNSFLIIKTNFFEIIKRSIYLNFWGNTYINANNLFPILAASPMYFSKAITLGILMQIVSAFGKIDEALSIIVVNFSSLASLTANIQRLINFNQQIQIVEQQFESTKIHITKNDLGLIEVKNLHLTTAENNLILQDINLVINPGEKIVIKGRSGIGKSSIIRAMAGLWPYGEGLISIPNDVMFIPQKAYMPIATLREALLYPNTKTIDDSELIKIMQLCNLNKFDSLLDEYRDWSKTLSPGEQQRVNLVRLFIYKPKILIMDEPTSSLDEFTEQEICTELFKILADSTILTISHTSNLDKFHDQVIMLN